MILTALMECYDMLKKKYGTEAPHGVPEFGFSREQPDFCIVLNREGEIKLLEEIETGTVLILPTTTQSTSRSGTTACEMPHFLWDKTDYVFGSKNKPGDCDKHFLFFKKKCEEVGKGLNDEGMQAVLKFLDNWDFNDIENNPQISEKWSKIKGKQIVFQLYGNHGKYISDSPSVKEAWKTFVENNELEDNRTEKGEENYECVSLLTGKDKPIARLHRKAIKGGMGALVSFNFKAGESYGIEGNFNAPIGIDEAFKYATALNYLLEDNPKRYKVMLGSVATIFWAEKDIKTTGGYYVEETLRDSIQNPRKPNEKAPENEKKIYEMTVNSLKSFNEALRKGQKGIDPKDIDKLNTKFYILGLEKTSLGRISVRFWLQTSIDELFQKLAKHLKDIELKDDSFSPPSIYNIVRQLKHKKKDDKRWKDTEDTNKFNERTGTIATDLALSVLTGIPYPEELLWGILDRIKKDSDVNFTRVSMLKGILVRNGYLDREQQRSNLTEEALMALDEKCDNVGYVLGRLFAAYEKAQSYYHWKERGKTIDKTIRDRYYGTASTTPLAIFPTLDNLSQVHLSKSGWLLPIIEGITNLLEAKPYPAVLPPPEQALFTLGYYHERAELRQKKRDDEITPDDSNDNEDDNN